MRTDEMARTYNDQAEARLDAAKSALEGGNHPFTIRLAQECVELSLKGALRLVGVEYPREHDVSAILSAVKERFPESFSNHLDKMGEISRDLARKRGPSMYGDEEEGVPPSELFQRTDAEKALSDAKYVHEKVGKVLQGFKREREG
ncbi:hypothetical protein AKJ64_01195 [candidate division MSBL1 archaeon SCGC-AAA259E17]|uniref:HEPN domain-containing protein n=1 Tax=candidate division MSBL1 archaeon SCGC-AAA259E17 TaxID=1698263 RepID=A0A133UG70_9EURY|nr:hypothetical protein AKJ64_01195 [candidate division MSBL1 archaeon SCGC-AAA259E17]